MREQENILNEKSIFDNLLHWLNFTWIRNYYGVYVIESRY